MPTTRTRPDKSERDKLAEAYGIDPNSLLTPVRVFVDNVLPICRQTAYDQIRRGTFPFTTETIGRLHYVVTSEAIDYIESHNGKKK